VVCGPSKDKRKGQFLARPRRPALRPEIVKQIINECIYGVDIDAEAVKWPACPWRFATWSAPLWPRESPTCSSRDRLNFGMEFSGWPRFRAGLNGDVVSQTLPFDWRNKTMASKYSGKGGFDAIVAIPLTSKSALQRMDAAQYRYLKDGGVYETTAQGKTDIACPSWRRDSSYCPGVAWDLSSKPLFQNRLRRDRSGMAETDKAIAEVEDFRDLQIFRPDHLQAILIPEEQPSIRYQTFSPLRTPRLQASVDGTIEWVTLTIMSGPSTNPTSWLSTANLLPSTVPSLTGGTPDLRGLQTLYGKFYQFEPLSVTTRTVSPQR